MAETGTVKDNAISSVRKNGMERTNARVLRCSLELAPAELRADSTEEEEE